MGSGEMMVMVMNLILWECLPEGCVIHIECLGAFCQFLRFRQFSVLLLFRLCIFGFFRLFLPFLCALILFHGLLLAWLWWAQHKHDIILHIRGCIFQCLAASLVLNKGHSMNGAAYIVSSHMFTISSAPPTTLCLVAYQISLVF